MKSSDPDKPRKVRHANGTTALELGTHGKVSTCDIGDGRSRATARMRTWDGDIHQVTAVGDTAADARALLERRMADRLRLSELHAWRYLTAEDPLGDVALHWLDCLSDWTNVSAREGTPPLAETDRHRVARARR